MPRTPICALLLLVSAAATAASAQETHHHEAACPAAAALPAELSSWTTPSQTNAATTPQGTAAAKLILGQATDLALAATPEVTYALRPERPGGSVSHGGMAAVQIATAGVYRVAIDTAAWLDVVAEGKSLDAVAHGHGAACSGVRKMVDFKLEPGTYVLQIVGNGSSRVRVLVASVPAK